MNKRQDRDMMYLFYQQFFSNKNFINHINKAKSYIHNQVDVLSLNKKNLYEYMYLLVVLCCLVWSCISIVPQLPMVGLSLILGICLANTGDLADCQHLQLSLISLYWMHCNWKIKVSTVLNLDPKNSMHNPVISSYAVLAILLQKTEMGTFHFKLPHKTI